MIEPSAGCPLCQLEKATTWYHEGADFVVLDCDTCGVPMAVWCQHGEVDMASPQYAQMLAKLAEVADQVFGKENWWLDPIPRSIPGHSHAHARPRGGWFRFG